MFTIYTEINRQFYETLNIFWLMMMRKVNLFHFKVEFLRTICEFFELGKKNALDLTSFFSFLDFLLMVFLLIPRFWRHFLNFEKNEKLQKMQKNLNENNEKLPKSRKSFKKN